MISLLPPHRRGRAEDALAMAELVNMAGEGLPLYVWSMIAEKGQSPWEVGQYRAMREEGSFSYRNATVREENGKVVSCLVGYPLPEIMEPANYDGMPPMFVPLQQLEDKVPGTWYVNVLATYPEHRGNGNGGKLLQIAEQLAADANRNGLSVIVSDANAAARRLYEKHGYKIYSSRPMIKNGWKNDGKNWILLVRNI